MKSYKLYYWPLPFRGSFITYLFAYRGVALDIEDSVAAISEMKDQAPAHQAVPHMGPPVLEDLESGHRISQVPAIALHISGELDLLPKAPITNAMALKVLMDCNDLLMELSRYNGSMMWDEAAWAEFRSRRLPRWLQIFESELRRQNIGRDEANFADIGVYALFGNIIRCLPELEPDILEHCPGIHKLCEHIGSNPTLSTHVAWQETQYGKLYCGGQIEQSIRDMLSMDALGKS